MSVRVVDLSGALKQALYAQLADNLGAAAQILRAEIQADIGTQGPPRSDPGDPPHRDSGELQDSFFDDIDANNLVARVGSTSDHVLPMELGTPTVAARPHIVSNLIKHADALGQRICEP